MHEFAVNSANRTQPGGVLDLVNFGCFVPSRCECFHCNATRKAIKACTNFHAIQEIEHTPAGSRTGTIHENEYIRVWVGQTPIPIHKPHDRNSDHPGCTATPHVTCDAE